MTGDASGTEQTFSEYAAEMTAEGYSPGPPPWWPSRANEIEREIAEGAVCSRCGHVGMEFHPYVNTKIQSYRSHVVCRNCGDWEEF